MGVITMSKAKEVPSFTKPLKGTELGKERSEGFYKKGSPTRDHKFQETKGGQGYGNVGKKGENKTQYPSCCEPGDDRTDKMRADRKCERPAKFPCKKAGDGYDGQKGNCCKGLGEERKESFYKRKDR
jgi:hypothetical protein